MWNRPKWRRKDAFRTVNGVRWVAAAKGALILLAGCCCRRRIVRRKLWRERREWLAVVRSGIYRPFEVYELLAGVSFLKLMTFTVNLAVVAYMSYKLWCPYPELGKT